MDINAFLLAQKINYEGYSTNSFVTICYAVLRKSIDVFQFCKNLPKLT